MTRARGFREGSGRVKAGLGLSKGGFEGKPRQKRLLEAWRGAC